MVRRKLEEDKSLSEYLTRYKISNSVVVKRWLPTLLNVFTPISKTYEYGPQEYPGAGIRASLNAIEWEANSALDRKTWDALQAVALAAGDAHIAIIELEARKILGFTFDWTSAYCYPFSIRTNLVYPVGTSWNNFRADGTASALHHPVTRRFVEDEVGRFFIVGDQGKWGLLFDEAAGLGTSQLGFVTELDQVVQMHFADTIHNLPLDRQLPESQLPTWARDEPS